MGTFNPWVILRDHFATLRNFASGRIAWGTVVVLLVLPAVPAWILLQTGLRLNEVRVGILITSMSIFAALLFNLLMLVYDIVRKAVVGADSGHASQLAGGHAVAAASQWQRLQQRFLREIFANLSFAVLVSLVVVVFLMTWLVVEDWLPAPVSVALAGLSYYGIGVFLLTFFMVLQRVHILLSDQFDHGTPGSVAASRLQGPSTSPAGAGPLPAGEELSRRPARPVSAVEFSDEPPS